MFSIIFQQICFCTFSTFKNIALKYRYTKNIFQIPKLFYHYVLLHKLKKLKETKSLTKWNILGKLGQTLYGYQLIYYVWIILKGQYLLLHRTDMIFLTSVLTTELCKTDIYWFFVCFGINFLSFLSQWSIR